MRHFLKSFVSIILFLSTFILFACSPNLVGQDKVLHEKTFQISPGKLLKLESSVGDISLTGWNKSEVYVKISGNEDAEEDIEFSFDNDPEEVTVKAKLNRSTTNWSSSKYQLKYEIKVPAEFNSALSSAGGDISITGVNGKNNLSTSGGDLYAHDVKGELKFSTSGGDINFEGITGEMKFSTSGGDIKGKNFFGDLDVATSGGDIQLIGKDTQIDATTSGGDIMIDYSGENKGIKLSTSGGDIDILIPSDFNASAKLSTSGGKVKSDFKGNNAVKISSQKFEADINSGGNPLIAKTSGGTIKVSKK